MRGVTSLSILILSALPLVACDCGEGLLDVSARLSVAPLALDFGEVAVGGLRVQGVTLVNEGASLLTITRFELLSASGEIAFASQVPQTVAPGAPLEVNLAYEPVDVGEDLAVLVIESNDGLGEHRVDVRGEGVIGGIAVSHDGDLCAGEEGLGFGQVEPGQVVSRTVTITAIGGRPITVLSAVLEPGSPPEFEIDAIDTPVVLDPAGTLNLGARYRPVDGGSDVGAFVITTDSPDMPSIRIPVCGAGIAPALCGRPVPLDFGRVPMNGTATATLTVESCGLVAVNVSSVQLTGDPGFSLVSTPSTPLVLAPGDTMEVTVVLTALSIGSKRGEISVASSLGQPTLFPVIAEVATPCDLVVAPSRVVYPTVAPGATALREVLVANNGAGDCTVTRIEVVTGAEFSVARVRNVPFALRAGVSELVAVQYAPTSTATVFGVLEVDGGNVERVDLVGSPAPVDGCAVSVNPSVLQFGSRAVGSTSMSPVRLQSIGGDACRIRSVNLLQGSPEFSAVAPVPGLILPNRGTDLAVSYRPTSAGTHFEVLEIEVGPLVGGGMTTLHQVPVVALAADAALCVNPLVVDFGTVTSGTIVSRTVDVASCGGADLDLRGVLRGPGTSPTFQLSTAPSIPVTLPPGTSASPTLTIEYAPTDVGPHFGQIDLVSSDSVNPVVSVQLTGNWVGGCTRILDCAPSNLDFGSTDVGITKIRSVVCRNASSDPVTISSAAVTGGPSMSLVANTPATLAPGGVWSAEVRFTPTAAQPVSASLAIVSDACQAPAAIPLAGIGRDVVRPDCIAPTTFSPQVEWSWTGSAVEPAFNNVWMTPLVANLTDDNADGRVDENDTPDVVFTSFDDVPLSDPTGSRPGVLRVVSGDTGIEHFSVTSVRFAESAQLAIGDIDGDGFVEIIGSLWVETPEGTGAGGFQGRYVTGNLVALDRFGNVVWISDPWTWPSLVLWNASAPYLVDMDGDGFSEIILGNQVFNHQGRLLWSGTGAHGHAAGGGPHGIAVDITLDGVPEVLAGGTAYNADGTILWRAQRGGRNIGEGGVSVGMLDPADPFPQVALDANSALFVLDHLGQVMWSVDFVNREPTATLPVIADFDGDGDADVAVADGAFMRAYTGTGTLIFTVPVMDSTCCAGITAFDFEGDGSSELVLQDFGQIYAYRGTTGAQIYSAPRLNPTNLEIPVIADIDNDRRAEILVTLYDSLGNGGGVTAYTNAGNSWVAAPRIWNQQAYHVTNVTEAGAIPRVQTPIPQAPPVFRATIADCVP